MVLQGKDYLELVGHCCLHSHRDITAAASLLCDRKLSLLNAKREKKKRYEEGRPFFLRVKYPQFKLFDR